MPYISLDNTEVFYQVVGEGIPLLLYAGLASDSASWGPLLPHIQNQFQIIMVDNRGCGQTKDLGGPISPSSWIDDALAVLDHLNIEHFCIMGHSMGGILALRTAVQEPDRVAAIITMAAADAPPPKAQHLVQTLKQLRDAGVDEKLWMRVFFQFLFAPAFFENHAEVDAAIEASLAYPHRQSKEDFNRQTEALETWLQEDLSQIQVPVLSISGRQDIFITHDAIETSLAPIPMLTTLQIEGAGHSLHWDQPEAVANAIKLFLSEDNGEET